jgi:CBS domain containing-hemolysin-like protein
LYCRGVDSLSGLLVSKTNRLLRVGDRIALQGVTAEVVEVQAGRAVVVRIRRAPDGASDTEVESSEKS